MTLLTDLFPGSGGGSSGGLTNIVEDTTPQLGGDLDMNGHNIGGNTETQLDDAVAKKHAANADIALGAQSENLNMNTHKIVGVVDPVGAQDVATKAYGDANWAGGENVPTGSQGNMLYKGSTAWLAGQVVFMPEMYTGTDTVKIQAAIDAAEVTGGTVYLPAKTYNITAALTITKGIKMVGDGPESYLHSTNGNAHIISIATDDSVLLEDLYLTYAEAVGQPSVGKSCIYVTDTNGDNSNSDSHFIRVSVGNGYYGFHFYRASYWSMTDCHIGAIYHTGAFVENHYNSDEGDSIIKGCKFIGRTNSHAGLQYNSSGGLKVVGNKFLGNFDYNIDIYGEEHYGSGGLNSWVIVGNSIEDGDLWGIRLRDNGATPVDWSICGNEITKGIYLNGSAVGKVLVGTITGNLIGGTGLTGTATIKLDYADYINIAGNQIRVGGSATYGVQVVHGTNNSESSNGYRNVALANRTNGTFIDSSISGPVYLSENLNMNTHKIVGVVDPVGAQDVATKAYGDANWAGGGGSVSTSGTPVDNDFAKFTDSLTIEGRSYSETRTDLGLVIGTNVQAYDTDLTTLGGLAKTNGNFIVGNGSTWVTESGATARTSLGLGSAAIRNAEDTMTDGGNLPDGHAIKAYGDANWAGGGSSDKISEGDSSVEVVDTGNGSIRFTEDGTEIAKFCDATLRIVGANPGIWLDETGTGNKGAYLVLDEKLFQIQRRAQDYGAHEASPFVVNIATGKTEIVGTLDMNTHKIVGVVDPTANQEAATKKYVDDNAGGVSDIAYASSWNGVTGIAPSKNAIWDWTKPYTESVTAPPGSYGNHDSINTAFNGNINKLQFPVKHTITGSTTAGQPTSGYSYRPEIFPHYTYLDNSSGHNQSTSSNSGRTGICAYRTKVFQQGQGDAVCYNGSVYVHTTKSGSTNFLANPAGIILNGDVFAGVNGAYLNAMEINSTDNGYDAAANPFVLNLNRTNNTGAKSAWWNGVRIQSNGSKAIESAFHLNGKALWGIDFTLATITNSAIALKSGQKIEFNATAGTYNASADGGKYIKYDGIYLCSSTHFKANGQLRCNNFRIDQAATAEVNTSATHYVGIEVNGVTYKVLLKSV